MAKAKTLIKGNYAIAEAAVRAGCKFFAGYPITPQSEIPEYMSWRMPEVGGKFVQTESEISGINMVFGAAACGMRAMTGSSGPGFSLMQEGISYLAAAEVPAVIVDVTRFGNGLGMTSAAQGDYFQLAKNGGHGDYRCIVLTPGNLQEAVDFVGLAFDLADKYKNPVIVAPDGSTGQMVEAVEFPDEIKEHNQDQPYAIKKYRDERPKRFANTYYFDMTLAEANERLLNKISDMKSEARWESFMTEDAEVILVTYGTMSRVCKAAVIKAREQGIKLGMIRPQTIWPFPEKAFEGLSPKGYLSVELCLMPQMYEDVKLAVNCKTPVYTYAAGAAYPSRDQVIAEAVKVLEGKAQEV